MTYKSSTDRWWNLYLPRIALNAVKLRSTRGGGTFDPAVSCSALHEPTTNSDRRLYVLCLIESYSWRQLRFQPIARCRSLHHPLVVLLSLEHSTERKLNPRLDSDCDSVSNELTLNQNMPFLTHNRHFDCIRVLTLSYETLNRPRRRQHVARSTSTAASPSVLGGWTTSTRSQRPTNSTNGPGTQSRGRCIGSSPKN